MSLCEYISITYIHYLFNSLIFYDQAFKHNFSVTFLSGTFLFVYLLFYVFVYVSISQSIHPSDPPLHPSTYWSTPCLAPHCPSAAMNDERRRESLISSFTIHRHSLSHLAATLSNCLWWRYTSAGPACLPVDNHFQARQGLAADFVSHGTLCAIQDAIPHCYKSYATYVPSFFPLS